MKKLLIVDGNSTLNRAFYGIRPLTTKDGLHTNALFGLFQILLFLSSIAVLLLAVFLGV